VLAESVFIILVIFTMKLMIFSLLTLSMPCLAATAGSQYVLPPSGPGTAAVSFPLVDTSATADTLGHRTLRFQLPEDLMGPNSEVLSLVQKDGVTTGFTQFSDGEVSASCVESATGLNCVMKYPPNYVNTETNGSVPGFLKTKYAENPSLLSAAISNQERFRSDPEGSVFIFF